MAFENITVRQFMKAWFRSDFSEISEDEFKLAKTEYIDLAGLYDENIFQKVSYIYFINSRINSINLSLTLQSDFLFNFGAPYKPGFQFLKKFGHRLEWKNDEEDFLKQLERIRKKESKYTSILENEMIEVKKLQAKENQNENEELDIKNTRERFLRTLNTLGKIGYRIDYDKTTVEEVALMIKQQTEEVENLNKIKK